MGDKNDERMLYIVVKGMPEPFAILGHAEERAAELCEMGHEDYTVMVVPESSLEHAITARYHGVVLHATSELKDTE